MILRPLLYLWAFPTTLIGLGFIVIGLLSGGRAKVVEGVLEGHGGFVTFFLRHGTLLKGGASAMTLGHVVIGLDRQALSRTRRHERVHVRQCERWGPLFLPAYFVGCAIGFFRSRSPYMDNPFEREAYEMSD